MIGLQLLRIDNLLPMLIDYWTVADRPVRKRDGLILLELPGKSLWGGGECAEQRAAISCREVDARPLGN